MEKTEYAIQAQHLRKTFDGNEFVLNDLSLAIPKGSLTVIIGYSGTGKSVFLKHIIGLMKPTSGDIRVLGEDLVDISFDQLILLRQKMGVLFQNSALFDDMTSFENVCFPIREHRAHHSENEMRDIAVSRLHSVGIQEQHFDKKPDQLSGGMRKRVALARALALDPEILLYDEPTTGLDPIRAEMVDNLIVETHHSRKGQTSVVISHDIASVFRIGDFIVMLDAGRVLLSGTPEDFYQSDIELVKKFVNTGMRNGNGKPEN